MNLITFYIIHSSQIRYAHIWCRGSIKNSSCTALWVTEAIVSEFQMLYGAKFDYLTKLLTAFLRKKMIKGAKF